MADGFKKIFNGTTVAGRANVAKATYATMALIYLIYRVRRKDPKPPKEKEDPIVKEPEPSNEKPEKDCAVCRERVRLRDKCDDPPPPPPTERRNCKCEEPPPIKVPSTPHQKQSQACSNPDADTVHPPGELISKMQESASRVLRNIIGAVKGQSPASVETNENHNDEPCSCCKPPSGSSDMFESSGVDQVDDEGCDYETSNQVFNSQRRTAPRYCDSSNAESAPLPEQMSNESQSKSQSQAPFRCFDEQFASEIFFGDE